MVRQDQYNEIETRVWCDEIIDISYCVGRWIRSNTC